MVKTLDWWWNKNIQNLTNQTHKTYQVSSAVCGEISQSRSEIGYLQGG
jgi:hypothetical protein